MAMPKALASLERAMALLRHRPPPSQKLYAAFARQEALDYIELELRFVLFHETL
jgi:hypothetical protein